MHDRSEGEMSSDLGLGESEPPRAYGSKSKEGVDAEKKFRDQAHEDVRDEEGNY